MTAQRTATHKREPLPSPAVNDAPVNTVPGPQNTNEETVLVFSSGNGNQISIGDVDAGVSPLQVTLTATNGTLTLSGLAGLSFTTGDGTGRRHDDLHGHDGQHQCRLQRPELLADRRLQWRSHLADHHQRSGQHRQRRSTERHGHGEHHRQCRQRRSGREHQRRQRQLHRKHTDDRRS